MKQISFMLTLTLLLTVSDSGLGNGVPVDAPHPICLDSPADGFWVLDSDDDVIALKNAANPWITRTNEDGDTVPWVGTLECLEVTGNVTDLSPLGSMAEVITFVLDLYIHDTISLRNLSGLETLTLLSTLGIGANAALEDIEALENVVEINQLAEVNPGSLCRNLKLPFVLHPDVPSYPDGTVFYSEASEMRSPVYGPAAINGVNESCLANSGMSDTELETRIRGLFDAIYPPQQYTQQIADYRQTFTIGQGTLRISASDNVPECELKEATLSEANSAVPGALAEIDFLIGNNCIPKNQDWVEDPLIVFDFGEDLPAGLEAGKLKNGDFQPLKRAKIVGPFLIYKLFDNAITDSGRVWKGGCHSGERYGPDNISYLEACTGIDDLDEDPRHGYLRDPLLLVLPISSTQGQPVPTLPLLSLLFLGGLVGLFGLRKRMK